MKNTVNLVRHQIAESIAVKQKMADEQAGLLVRIAECLAQVLRVGGTIYLFGNGGSAADAQHIAAEFVGKFHLDRKPLPAEALTVNTSLLTAIGNDYAFEQIFAYQVKALGNPGDVAIGISTSGNSPNVLEAIRTARIIGMITIGLTGADGGHLINEVDYCVCVPSKDTPRIQEAHILISHIWCELIEQALFGHENE